MITHNRPTIDQLEIDAAVRVLHSRWISKGPEVEAFEREMCVFHGLPDGHAVAVSSGSAALYLALLALGAKNKDIAIPAYSCRSLWNAVNLIGGNARYIDTAEGRPVPATNQFAVRNEPIAIVAHMFGTPVRIPKDNVGKIVEDCSQALGAQIDGIPIGCTGDLGIFSFGATKPITSGGQGGMVISRDCAIIQYIREYCDYDRNFDSKPSFNLQMTDLEAAIGRVQLARIPEFCNRRQYIFDRYHHAGLPVLDIEEEGTKAFRFRAVIRVENPQKIQERMQAAGIRTIVPVKPEELLAPLEEIPNALAFSESTLSLPLYPSLTDTEVNQIIRQCQRSLEL